VLRILRRAVYEELYLGHVTSTKGGINKHDDVNEPPVDLRAVCLVRAMVEEVCGNGLTSANSAFMATRPALSNQRVF
jgi:hypothetical protein